jgi:tagatose 6-phosphate kinase
MILAAGLSPAWQHTLFFKSLEIGEVNRAVHSTWCASGKVVNVAAALASLGAEHRMLTVVGGWPEEAFRKDVAASRIHADLISVRTATRVCTTLIVKDGPTTELVEECGSISDEFLQAFESFSDDLFQGEGSTAAAVSTRKISERSAFEAAFAKTASSAKAVVVSGSTPKRFEKDFWRTLLVNVKAPCILDIRGEELLEALSAKPLLVKPNREELAATVGRPLSDEAAVIRAAEEIRGRGAQWVLVTDGTKPAILVGDETFRIHSTTVMTVNPIGCGDSLAAGIAWRVSLGDAVPEAVRWGVAAAAANAETELPARFSRHHVDELVSEIVMERIDRE